MRGSRMEHGELKLKEGMCLHALSCGDQKCMGQIELGQTIVSSSLIRGPSQRWPVRGSRMKRCELKLKEGMCLHALSCGDQKYMGLVELGQTIVSSPAVRRPAINIGHSRQRRSRCASTRRWH